MKNPTHPGGFGYHGCIEPSGLTMADTARGAPSYTNAVGLRERKARNFCGHSCGAVEDVRRQRRNLLKQRAHYDVSQAEELIG